MSKILYIFFVLLSVLLSQFGKGQNSVEQHQIDSLKNELTLCKEDTNKVKTLIRIGYELQFNNPKQGLYYCNQALKLSESLHFSFGIAQSYLFMARCHNSLGSNDSSLKYCFKSLKLFESLKRNDRAALFNISNCLEQIGITYTNTGQNDSAEYFLKKSFHLSANIKDLPLSASIALSIGRLYFNKGQNDSALNYYFKSLKIAEAIPNYSNAASICQPLFGIGIIFGVQNDFKKSLQYNIRALEIAQKLNDKYCIAVSNLQIGLLYIKLNDYTKAEEYLSKSIDFFKKSGDKNNLSSCYGGFGQVYYETYQSRKALDYYFKSAEIDQATKFNTALAITYGNIGLCYVDLGMSDSGIYFYKKALQISKNRGEHEIYLYQVLSGVYKDKNDYKNALEYYQMYASSKDSLFNQQKSKQIAELEIKYQTEKKQLMIDNLTKDQKIKDLLISQQKQSLLKQLIEQQRKQQAIDILNKDNELQALILKNNEKEIAEQKLLAEKKQKDVLLLQSNKKLLENEVNKKNLMIWGVGLIFILFSVIGYYIYRQSKLKGKNIAIRLEQKLLRSQMNPHFIFNSLFAIQNFMLQNNGPEAAKYLSKFSKLIRMILENSREEYVSLEKEIETLKYYMELQTLRFKNKFDYNIEIDESIENDQTLIPPMLAQPLIENAIEHGFKGKEDKGHIHIKFSSENNYLICEVEDNGIGREQSKLINSTKEHKHQSLATSIVKERLERYNQGAKSKIKLDIIDKEDNNSVSTGTKAIFYIPSKRA